MKRVIGLLSILVAASAFAMGAPPTSQDPPQEDALWAQIHEDLNNNRRNEAAQKLESFLQRFPSSVRAPEALFHLASTYEQRNRAKAVEKYLELVQKHPKHDLAPQALLNAGASLRQLGKKDEAKAAFRRLFKEYPGSNASQSGLWQFWSIDNKNFQFSVNRTFAEDQPVSVSAFFRNVDKVDYSLFKLDTSAVLKRIESGAVFSNIQELIGTVPAAGREKLKEWSDQPKYDANKYSSNEVKVEVPGPGLYIFRAVHDEIPVEVGLVVARYGLVVKSAPNRTIVFAVDRRTGRALPKMSLRFSEGERKVQGITGEDGLFTLDRGFNGTVVGLMDGEVALTNVWSNGSGDEMKTYLFTDRPIYRPNQTVHFKAIHRILKPGGEFENVSQKTAKIEIRDPRGNVIYQKELTTNTAGSIDGELRLGDEPPLGHYYIMSTLGGYGQFRVEEYRKPEYEVKAKFEGGARIQGDELKVEVSVDYYFGSPVVDSEISYEIRRRPHYKFPWRCFYAEWDWYDDGDEDDDDEAPVRRGRPMRGGWAPEEVVTKGVGKTDKRGKFRMACSTAKSDQDHVYSVVARVVDRSRREVQGRAEVKVARSNLELNIAASKYLYSPGDTVIVRAKLADLDGKPAADREVALSAATSNWRRRGDQGEYEHTEFFAGTTRTDAQGVSEFSFPADKEGYIRFRCVAKDDRGTEISEERWVWICGASWSGNFQNLTGLDLVPDREIYKPGETAKILITSQAKGAHVLFTVEGDGIYRHEILKVKDHTITVDVPIDGKRHTPNVFFGAVTMSGNEFLASVKSVNVPPADRLLTVKIRTDKDKYRPREKAQVTVEVTDAAGKPVVTDLSLSLVDESIYALQRELAPDIRKFFFAKRWNRTTVSSSMHYYDYGRAGDAKAPSAASDGMLRKSLVAKESARGRAESKDDGGMAESEVRGNFPDTWHWSPAAATDASGRFTFATEVPDSLTTWRATARAATTDTRVGQAKLEFIARKEIIVRLTTPRFFTQKDACVVSGVVHNYRDDVDEVLVSLEAEGVEVEGPREVKVKLAKGEDKRVDWKLKAATAGSAKLLGRARTPKESDAMQLVIPILPHGSLEAVTKAGTAEGAVREKLVLPGTAIREASELTISIAPSVASQVTGALEFLAGYPYGCVEQTMSRFLPSVVAARAMQQMGVKNDKLQKELPDMVLAGLQRLYNFQHGDGGWGWWEGDQSHPFMTAYVVYGLAKAREADHAVDPGVLQRGVELLKRWALNLERARPPATNVLSDDELSYILFALSEAGAQDLDSLMAQYRKRESCSDYGRALLALSLARAGKMDEAGVVLANLDETAKQGEAYCYWEGHRQKWHWMSHSIETTAYVLRAYGKVAPKDPKIHKIVRWLAANRHGNRWHSTKDTAAIVYALSEYASASGELDAEFALTVKVNGKELISAKVDKSNLLTFDGTRVLKGLDVPAGETVIEISREGKGVVYYSAHLRYFNAADTFKPSNGTVAISRTYAKVRWEGKDKIADELKEGDTVTSGDIVEVTLTLDAAGLHEYMMIEDPIPAGFEIQKEEDRFYGGWAHRRWGWWYSRIEARDEKVCVAATSLNGHQSVSYLLRAETPGEFRILPTRAWNMYVPEIAGSSAGFRLNVKDKE